MAEKIQASGQWDIKYLREQPFMPFGSLMNAFGQINQGKGMTIEKFEENTKRLFDLTLEFTKKTYERVEDISKGKDIELPQKKK